MLLHVLHSPTLLVQVQIPNADPIDFHYSPSATDGHVLALTALLRIGP
jgi:hypothetical protein